ncbi:uncharacterized protein [Miscanthus floridulus]
MQSSLIFKLAAPALLGKTHDPAFKWKFYGFSALLDRGAVSANSAIFRCCGYGWVGGGKKHGRYWMGDGVIDTSSTPTLSQIRARSTSASPAIRPRPTTASHLVNELQAQLLEERRLREEMEARAVEEREAQR